MHDGFQWKSTLSGERYSNIKLYPGYYSVSWVSNLCGVAMKTCAPYVSSISFSWCSCVNIFRNEIFKLNGKNFIIAHSHFENWNIYAILYQSLYEVSQFSNTGLSTRPNQVLFAAKPNQTWYHADEGHLTMMAKVIWLCPFLHVQNSWNAPSVTVLNFMPKANVRCAIHTQSHDMKSYYIRNLNVLLTGGKPLSVAI